MLQALIIISVFIDCSKRMAVDRVLRWTLFTYSCVLDDSNKRETTRTFYIMWIVYKYVCTVMNDFHKFKKDGNSLEGCWDTISNNNLAFAKFCVWAVFNVQRFFLWFLITWDSLGHIDLIPKALILGQKLQCHQGVVLSHQHHLGPLAQPQEANKKDTNIIH